MESLSLKEENTIKDLRHLFRLKNIKLNYTAIKFINNLFRPEKETKAITDRIRKDIQNPFDHKEEENYHKAVKVSNFWSKIYMECKSNSNRNKTL